MIDVLIAGSSSMTDVLVAGNSPMTDGLIAGSSSMTDGLVAGNSPMTGDPVAGNSHMTGDFVAGNSHMTDVLVAGNSHFLQFEHATGEPSHMTDDLLGKIFHHLCEPGPLSLRHLLSVSRRFYSVAVNNAHLWTTISLDYTFFHHFRYRPEQGNGFVEHCLLRSGPLPLCLYIDQSRLNPNDSTFLLPPLETFGESECGSFQRCTSLIWDARNHGTTTIQMFVDLLPKSLPSLKHIFFTNFDDPIGGSQFPNCPLLERVEMVYYDNPSPRFWGTNFLHVTTLTLGIYYSWAGFDLATLALFPVLHDLTLCTLLRSTALYSIHSRSPIIFSHLHILRAHGCIPPEVLTKLVTPALEELHLKSNADNITSIGALQTSFNPLCQHIHALLPKAVSAEEPEWAINLSKLVQKCTGIRSIHISRWMEEECKKYMSSHDVVLHVQ